MVTTVVMYGGGDGGGAEENEVKEEAGLGDDKDMISWIDDELCLS